MQHTPLLTQGQFCNMEIHYLWRCAIVIVIECIWERMALVRRQELSCHALYFPPSSPQCDTDVNNASGPVLPRRGTTVVPFLR